MVKNQKKYIAKDRINQGEDACPAKASKIGPSTAYGYCSELLNPFGGLLGLVKFMDLVRFKEIFNGFYKPPSRTPELGHYEMVLGLIMLLFIGFNRIWHLCKLCYEVIHIDIDTKEVILRGDGEFISWESVKAAFEEGYWFIFGNKACNPPFDPSGWYKVKRRYSVEYNECLYQPMGWDRVCRFVAMRIPKDQFSDMRTFRL